jgi:MscS family membrane protein
MGTGDEAGRNDGSFYGTINLEKRPAGAGSREVLVSEKGMTRLHFTALLLSFILLPYVPAFPQLAVPSTHPVAVKPDVPQDVLGRTTPRGTVLGFLKAGQKGDNAVAAEYLNTRWRGKAAAVLAHQLFVTLDRRLPAHLNQLSDRPEGSLSGGLNQELVGTINTASGSLDIIVERVDRGKSGLLWLFSSKTLESIPDLYQEVNVVSLHDVLPQFLVSTRVAGVVLFEWIAVLVGIPLLYLLTVLLNRLLSPLAGLLRRTLFQRAEPIPEVLPKPVRLLLLAAVIRWFLSRFSLPLSARQFWSSVAIIMVIAACLWVFLMLNGYGERYILRRLRDRELRGTASILRLGRRLIDVLSIFAALLVILRYFGVSPTTALAGLGVGGIAVALAAQKTLENVVGGVSLILDHAICAGDTLKLGETVGTVEDIGLRSTRIRTLDRTVVIVPNGQIANMNLETLSARDKFWFHPTVGLRYETTSAQILSVTDRIRNLLSTHSSVGDRASVQVRFLRFGAFSLDLEISAYVFARDGSHFLRLQEELLLSVMEIVQKAGAQIASPQTMYLAADSTGDGATRGRALAPEKEVGREGAVTKSA